MSPLSSHNREILAIALPAIVSNISTPVLGLVDVAITGHIGAAAYIGAIALGSTMFNMLYWLFGFLRMGTAGLTSQSCGAHDFRASSLTLARSLLIGLVIALLLIALSHPLGFAALNFLDSDDSTAPLARQYFGTVIFGAPAVLGMYTLNGWLLGMQNTRLPMFIAILTNIVNIAVSSCAVFILDMKLSGIALGTLTAQWVGFATCAYLVYRRYRPQLPTLAELFDTAQLARLFKINLDIFLRTLCLVAVTAWFTRAGSAQSVEILAANALLMQLFMFFSYFSDGFAFAGEALSGKMYGAGNAPGLRSVMRALLVWGAGIALLFTIVYFLCGNLIISLLTSDSHVISTASEYTVWAITIPACGIMAFIYDGVAVGLTRTRLMLLSIAVGMAVFFCLYFSLSPLLGNHGLWIAFLCYLAARGLVLHFALNKPIN